MSISWSSRLGDRAVTARSTNRRGQGVFVKEVQAAARG
jgi:hypothetical protein